MCTYVVWNLIGAVLESLISCGPGFISTIKGLTLNSKSLHYLQMNYQLKITNHIFAYLSLPKGMYCIS